MVGRHFGVVFGQHSYGRLSRMHTTFRTGRKFETLVTLYKNLERQNPGDYAMNSGGLNKQLPASHKMLLPGVKESHTYSPFTQLAYPLFSITGVTGAACKTRTRLPRFPRVSEKMPLSQGDKFQGQNFTSGKFNSESPVQLVCCQDFLWWQSISC